jgi:hypothetical protein
MVTPFKNVKGCRERRFNLQSQEGKLRKTISNYAAEGGREFDGLIIRPSIRWSVPALV